MEDDRPTVVIIRIVIHRSQRTPTTLFHMRLKGQFCCLYIRERQDLRFSGCRCSGPVLVPETSRYKEDLRDLLLGEVRRRWKVTTVRTEPNTGVVEEETRTLKRDTERFLCVH